jgi:hypothetical protein
MDADKLVELQDFYDTTDQSAALETAEPDSSTVDDPMVGITVRFSASTLNAAREVAAQRGVKVTAQLREWIEQQLADRVDDTRVIPVAELRRLIARSG